MFISNKKQSYYFLLDFLIHNINNILLVDSTSKCNFVIYKVIKNFEWLFVI